MENFNETRKSESDNVVLQLAELDREERRVGK